MKNVYLTKRVPLQELESRMVRFREIMNQHNPYWEIAVIFSKINIYYFTGTMQEGMLVIPRDDEAIYWVRKSYDRAKDESYFKQIKYMGSFRDAIGTIRNLPETVYMETEIVPLALYERFTKYFPFKNLKSMDAQLSTVRAIKSDYELSLMKKSGSIHKRILEDEVPRLLEEGMSELDLALMLYSKLVQEGHHGVSRFGMFDTEMGVGHVCFGESSIYPTYFNGPGGNYGMGPAVPFLGSRQRKLKKGDLVFIDMGCGVDGYHTDKTMTYMFGSSLSSDMINAHKKCVDIQNEIAEMLKPGEKPANIYEKIMSNLDSDFLNNFMGFGNRKVKFLGHGIGLLIDELPVIANGFKDPIQENMVFAVEPKKGFKDIGMVGIENTFIVTSEGGENITGKNPGLILV